MLFAYPATPDGQLQWVEAAAQSWVTNYPVTTETFGQLLRRLRENAGLSQEDLAEKVGLSRKTIQTIENTRGRPRIKNEVAVVTKMALHCKVRVGELSTQLGWVPTDEAKPTAWERGLTDNQKRAVNQVAELFRAAKAEDEPPEDQPLPRREAGS